MYEDFRRCSMASEYKAIRYRVTTYHDAVVGNEKHWNNIPKCKLLRVWRER